MNSNEQDEKSSLIGLASNEEDATVPIKNSSNKKIYQSTMISDENRNPNKFNSLKEIIDKQKSNLNSNNHNKNNETNDENSNDIFQQQQQLQQQQQQLIYSQLVNIINDRRSKFKQNASVVFLLLVSLLERFAFYGLISNFILYLNKQPLFWESYNASLILFIFFGITYISSLIGGWVADSLIGKYTTICLSFVIYIFGYLTFPYISYDKEKIPNICSYKRTDLNKTSIKATINSITQTFSYNNYTEFYTILNKDFNKMNMSDRNIFDETCSWLIILTTISIAFGVGFIKANLGPFGADQVTSRGQTMVFKYFNWLYWSINLGALISLLLLAYIQQNYSFFIGYLIPLIALFLSFLLFLLGSFCYLKTQAETSILTNVFRVIYEAFKSNKRHKKIEQQKKRERALLRDDEEDEITASQASAYSYNNLTDSFNTSVRKNISWLDNAKIRFGGSFDDNQVDDVKSLKSIIILFALLIPYWAVYFQIETTFIIQGLHMKLFSNYLDKSFMIPTAWLSIADQLTVLIMIPFLDSVIYPYFNKKFNKTICINSRLVLGMCLSALSVITAGILESIRLKIIQDDPLNNSIKQIIGNTTYIAADLHILWQIPQYMLIGLGEVFCSVCCIFYAYSASPKSMQSILMGIFYFFTGTGSFMGSIILYLSKKYIYSSSTNVDDINCTNCHLNYYFYSLALFQIIGVLFFILIDGKLKIVKCKSENNATKLFLSPDANINEPTIIGESYHDNETLNQQSDIINPYNRDASKNNYVSNIEDEDFASRNINI